MSMDTRRFTVDGVDSTKYGCCLLEHSIAGLIAWPSLKSVPSNDWHEESAIEADLSAPVLDTRELSINLYFDSAAHFRAFFDTLTQSSYHDYKFIDGELSLRLRLVSASLSAFVGEFVIASFRFADDFPLLGYKYSEPESNLPSDKTWVFDNVPFSKYGVKVLEGTRANGWALPSVRSNVTRRIASLPGAIYEDEFVRLKSDSFTLNGYMRDSSFSRLYSNWRALLYDLTQSGARQIIGDVAEGIIACCYRSCSVRNMVVTDNDVSLSFSITFQRVIADFVTLLSIEQDEDTFAAVDEESMIEVEL